MPCLVWTPCDGRSPVPPSCFFSPAPTFSSRPDMGDCTVRLARWEHAQPSLRDCAISRTQVRREPFLLLKDKVCVIAGAASLRGIGYATAELFAFHGAKLTVIDISMNERVANAICGSIQNALHS